MTVEAPEVSSASPPPNIGHREPSIPMTVEPASEGGFTTGLGNFKGVMLCNRPSDVEAERRAALDSKGPPPFKSSVAVTHNDPLGLTPPHAIAGPVVSRPKRTAAPTAALRKHTEWLRAFAEEVASKKAVREQLVKKENEKLKRITEFAAKQREDVRRVIESTEANAADGKENADGATESRECCIEEAVTGKKHKSEKRQRSKARPVWSLTEEQALEAAKVDEDELLAFAESVDFDQYINDLEFRTALAVMKDRAGRLSREEEKFRKALQEAYEKELVSEGAGEGNAEEEAFDDGIGSISGIGFEDSASQQNGPDDAASVSSVSVTSSVAIRARRVAEDGRPMWDAKPLPVDDETQSIVSQALKENHKIRSIHNERSVRGVLETLASKGGGNDDQSERSAASLRALQEVMAKPATRPLVVVSGDAAIEREVVEQRSWESFPRGLHGEWAGYLKLAQLALSSTDRWSDMSKEACLGLAVVACTTSLVAVGIARERQEMKKSKLPVDKRPTLALGGSGLRVGYMLGTVAAIRDHVDISNIRITAISGSAIGALLLSTPELDVVDVSLAVFRCRNKVVRKGVRNCYMMDVSKTAQMIVEELKTSAGLTEKMLQDRHHSEKLYFGLTSLRPWPTPVCKACPATFEEFSKVLAAVICIPPFFTETVQVDGYPSVDGFFSHLFATPDDHDPTKVIRYCPFPALWLTFRPPARDMISSLSECVFPYGLARHIASFEEGYLMTVDFLRSGTAESRLLNLKKCPVNRLSEYIKGLKSLQALV